MKILGIDYGEKRIGIAVSDETGSLARELDILSPKEFFKNIRQIIKDNEVGEIVVGWPLNMSGEETQKTKEVRDFKEELGVVTNVPVHTMDERLSSQMAQNLPGGNRNVDSLAAQIMLQNYLNKKANQ